MLLDINNIVVIFYIILFILIKMIKMISKISSSQRKNINISQFISDKITFMKEKNFS